MTQDLDRIVAAIEKLTEEVESMRQAVDNLTGAVESVCGCFCGHSFVKVKVMP